MTHLLHLFAAAAVLSGFTQIDGFGDLEEQTTPNGFGLLLVCSGESTPDSLMAHDVLSALEGLPADASTSLWCIGPDGEGFSEISVLTGEFGELPSVVVLVGHCGFLELDPSLLISEIVDSWFTWGDPESRITGICNFCRRCNPDL